MDTRTDWSEESRQQRARRREDARTGRPWPFNHLSDAVAGRLRIGRLGELAQVAFDGPVLIDTTAAGPRAPQRIGTVLLLNVLSGVASVRGAAEAALEVRPGGIVIASSDRSLVLRAGRGARLVSLVLPVHLHSPRFFPRDRVTAPPRPLAGPVARLIGDLIGGLSGPDGAQTSPGGLADAIGGLLSAALETYRPVTGQAALEPLGQARMAGIDTYLRRHFADPDLSAAQVAAAIGVSRRYLHKLYADCGRSFRQDLVALRIEACLRAFADNQQAGKTIAEIAFGAGYTDISQFNRHFRRLQDATPTAVRRTLLMGGGENQRPRRASTRAASDAA